MPSTFKILLPPNNDDTEPSIFELKELKKGIFTFNSKDDLNEFTLSSCDWLKQNSHTSERLYSELIKGLKSLKNLNTSSKNNRWQEYKNIDMCGQGDVDIVHNWRNKYSIDDLKKVVEDRNYSAISIGDFDHAALKKFDYQLEKKHCKPTEGYNNTFLIYFPNSKKNDDSHDEDEDEDQNEEGYWTEYHGIDMCHQGDVDIVGEWRKNTTIDELKKKVEKNNWSAISVSPFDKSYSHAALKNFDYQLSSEHCEEQEYEVTLYIYNRPATKNNNNKNKKKNKDDAVNLKKIEVGRVMSWFDYRDRAKEEGGRLPTTQELRDANIDVGYDQWTPCIPSEGDHETGRNDGRQTIDENCWANIGPRKYQIEYPEWGLNDTTYMWKHLTYFFVAISGRKDNVNLEKDKNCLEKLTRTLNGIPFWEHNGLMWVLSREKKGKLDEIVKKLVQEIKEEDDKDTDTDTAPYYKRFVDEILNSEDSIVQKIIKEQVKNYVNDPKNADYQIVKNYFEEDKAPSIEEAVKNISYAVKAVDRWHKGGRDWFLDRCNKIQDLWGIASLIVEDKGQNQCTYLMSSQDQNRVVGLLMQEGSDFLRNAKEMYEKQTGKQWNPEVFIKSPDRNTIGQALILVKKGSDRQCVFADFAGLKEGKLVSSKLSSHGGKLQIGKQHQDERMHGQWRVIYSEIIPCTIQMRDKAISLEQVDEDFIKLGNEDLVFDVCSGIHIEGQLVQFVGGTTQECQTKNCNGARNWIINDDGTISPKVVPYLVLGI